MGFSRSFLKTMGLTDEQIGAIMEEHTAVTDALKQQRDQYKADADKLPDIQKQLDEVKGGEDFKAKYDKEHEAFEAYKAQITREAEEAKVKAAYRKLLADEKVSEKRLDTVLKVTDISGMKLDKDGNLANADKLREAIKQDWGDFIVKTEQRVPKIDTPPQQDNGGKGLSRAAELSARYQAQKYGVAPAPQKE